MNKLFLCFALFLVPAFSGINAQFTKGTKIISTNIGSALFNTQTIDYAQRVDIGGTLYTRASIKNMNVSIAPGIGWFISPQIAVGGRLGLNYSADKRSDKDIASGNTYSKDNVNNFFLDLNAFSRYYFVTGKSWLPFAEASMGAGFGASSGDGFFYRGSEYKDVTDSKSSGDFAVNAGLLVGVTKMLGEQVGLDIFAGYKYNHYKNEVTKTTQRDIGMDGSIDERLENITTQKSNNNGLQIGIGLQIFLHKK